jgi:hypothetical protein
MLRDGLKREAIRYVRRNFDEAIILGALATAAFRPDQELTADERVVLAAFQRSSVSLRDADPDELRTYLRSLDDSQLPGVVSNVKGILHEVQFVEMEKPMATRSTPLSSRTRTTLATTWS